MFNKHLFTMKIRFNNIAHFKVLLFAILLIFISAFNSISAQITTLSGWTNEFHTTADEGTTTYSVPLGSNSKRLLVVAVATSTRTANTRTITTLTYGGQALTSINGDIASNTIQHTQFYYLNEAGIDAATNTNIVFTISGGTTVVNDIYVSVYDNVDQSNPIADSKNYNNGSTTTSTFTFASALTINAGDLALKVVNSTITASITTSTITGIGINWTSINQQTQIRDVSNPNNDRAVRTAIATRSIPTSNTTDVSTVTLNGTSLGSMTGVSLREAREITTGTITGSPFCAGSAVSVPYSILGTYVSGNTFTAQLSDANGSFASPITIGSVSSTTSGSISATIPTNTITDADYRIRVISSNPAVTGTNNGVNITINALPSAPTTTGNFICIGTTSGTVISASGAVSGQVYVWYDAASAGNVLKTSTDNADNTYTTPALSATTNYWVAIRSSSGCESARTMVTATYPTPSVADQTTAGNNSWIGHIYAGTNLNTYYGTTTQTETFDESFTGANTCFPFTSGANTWSIYTEQFSIRYQMNSTKKGLYIADLGADDGSRLYVDGNLVYNNWTDQAFISRPRVLMSLTGTSPLIYDFYENGGQNRVVFQNFTQVLVNNLSSNTSQTINLGNTGSAIGGDVYGTLPSGISLSGTGYQWTYSTTPGGARTNISGATGATYSPDASTAPFNAPGTYYIYRNAILSSSNNVSPNPYTATNESNAATLTVNTPVISSSTTTLSGFSYIAGNGPSTEQSFTVSGSNLGQDITITPTTNYEISTTSGSGFQSTAITLTQNSGSVSTTTIYVRLKAGLTAGNYNSEVIALTSSYATTVNVNCSGTVITPTISTSVTSLPQFSYNTGAGPSSEQSFTVSGTSLTAGITLTPSANFEISTTSGSGFQSTPIVLNQSGGIVNTTTIYVRLKSGLAIGSYNTESIAATSTGATSQTVSLTGVVNAVYCASSGNTSYLTSITLVNFNTINNVSAKPAGYSNYTAQITNVNAGSSYNLTVNLNTDGNYTIYAVAWFDWNNDGDFSDSGETFNLGSTTDNANGATSLSPLSILIPTNAKAGNVRMRVAAKWNVAPTACETNFDGEVEDYTLIVSIPSPSISATPTTLPGFTYKQTAGPSQIQSFNVTGSFLTDNITVTATSNFEVSTLGGTSFSSQPFVTLPVSGGNVNQTVYVRMKAGLSVGAVAAQNLIVSTPGASNVLVNCSGSVTDQPLITVNLTNLSGFSATYKGAASATQNFTVSGSNLMGDITLEAPTGYEIKTSAQSTYVTSLPLPQTAGSVATTTINVRLKSGLGVGSYTGNIVASSSYALSKTVELSGTVNPVATVTTNTAWLAGFIYTVGNTNPPSQTFYVNGTTLSANITLSVPTSPQQQFQLSTNGSTWSNTVTLTRSGNAVTNAIVYARLIPGLSVGTFGPTNVTITSTGAVVKTVALSGQVVNTPTILVSKTTLSGFGYLFGSGPSASQSVTVSGASLTNNIIVNCPANYELSTDNSTFSTNAIQLAPTSGTVAPTTIYYRLAAGLTAGSYGTSTTITSNGVSGTTTINFVGTVFATPFISSTGGGDYCSGNNVQLTSTGADVESQFWTGPNSFYTTAKDTLLANVTATQAGTYTVTGNVVVGGNLIYNGNFESGNTGVGSSYTYVTPGTSPQYPNGNLWPEATYTVHTNPNYSHANFPSCAPGPGDPTGNRMIINGAPQAGVVIWSQSVSVLQNADYEFSYFLQSVRPEAPSQLQLYINGVMAGPIYYASSTTCIWKKYIYNTNSGSNNILNLELINMNTIANGNDFCLDDIAFRQVLSATSSEVVNVLPNVTASVNVSYSPSTVNVNSPVVYTATPTNGGETPTYKWFVNGVEQVGHVTPTFTYTPLTTASLTVRCEMTSSLSCASPKPAIDSKTVVPQLPLANYWMGYVDTDWGKPENWTAGYVPATGDDVIYATLNNFTEPAQRDLQLDKNRTIGSLINGTIRRLIIPANLTLNCNNVITVTPPITDPITKVEDLIVIKASTSLPNGSIIYRNPQNTPAYGTVEMYSPASWDLSRPINQKYNWQYFGVPVASLPVLPTFYGTYVRELIESDPDTATHWRMVGNDYVMQPFKGYELCQKNANTFYQFKGQLVNSNYESGQLAKTPTGLYPGQHLFANPYTTAIDIRQIEFGTDMEATAYLYNTGTFISWRNNPSKFVLLENAVPGQYNSAPKEQAGSFPGIPRQIPSMGTFLVRILATKQSSAACFVKVNYNTVAMGNSERLRVKAASVADEQTATEIEVDGEFGVDKMWIMTHNNYTRDFDNGFDGKKMTGTALNPQIFAVESDGNYQINSINDIDNTKIAFHAGQDTEYTLKITHNEKTLERYNKIYLHDLVENKMIDISAAESKYAFTATSTSKPVLRFRILANNTNENVANSTHTKIYNFDNKLFVHNFSNTAGKVYVYDISGRVIGIRTIGGNENIQIPVSQHKVYLVKVVVDSVTETKKILLQ